MASMRRTVLVRFGVRCDTSFGQSVLLVGDVDTMGDWSVERA
jgi:hypothetical protein